MCRGMTAAGAGEAVDARVDNRSPIRLPSLTPVSGAGAVGEDNYAESEGSLSRASSPAMVIHGQCGVVQADSAGACVSVKWARICS